MPSRNEIYRLKLAQRKADGICYDCSYPTAGRTLCEKHRISHNELQNARNKEKKALGLCTFCKKPHIGPPDRCLVCRERVGRRRKNIRIQVLEKYGDRCVSCGEDDKIVLDLDHIYNNGSSERRKCGGSTGYYRKALKPQYTNDYQLLCRNCNWRKHILGGILPMMPPLE